MQPSEEEVQMNYLAEHKHNMRHWSEASNQELHMKSLHSQRVKVWCRISEFSIKGTYFFKWKWQCSYCDMQLICVYSTNFCFHSKTSWQWQSHNLIPKKWHDFTYCMAIHEHFKNSVWKSSNFPFGDVLDSPFAWSVSLQFLFMGSPEEQGNCKVSSKLKQNKGSNYGRT